MNSAPSAGVPYRIDPVPLAASEARRFVRQTLSEAEIAPGVIDTVELLTSELVTNMILHAGGPGELTVRVLPSVIQVLMSDHQAALPRLRAAGELAESGRGLVLVDAMADVWGVDLDDDRGKIVWFEVRRTPG